MRYLMLVVSDPTGEDTDGDVDAWFADPQVHGSWVLGERLRPPADARTVRVRGDETFVTDGPFAAAKEWIAGFDVLECADLDEAVAVAAKHPMARGGCVEVRAFWPLSDG